MLMSVPSDNMSEASHFRQSRISDANSCATAHMRDINDNMTNLMAVTFK